MNNTPLTLATLLFGACSAIAPVSSTDTLALELEPGASTATLQQQAQYPPGIPPPAQPVPASPPPRSGAPIVRPAPRWSIGQPLMQGFFGVGEFTQVDVDGGGASIDGDSLGEDMPVIGGGAQVKLGGERLDYGLEGMFSMGWQANASAVAIGGGGVAVAVDTDLFVFELYGGPFASMFIGEKLRVYGAAGPLMQWASYDQTNAFTYNDGSGFGYGYYTRLGVELQLPSRMWLGVGWRWSDTQTDLGDIGDLDIEGSQFVITLSRL